MEGMNRGEELLNVSVEIEEGIKDVLKVFEHDDLQLVVRNFFIKNCIVSESEEAFLDKVNHFMQELIQEHQLVNQALAVMPVFTSPVCKNFGERLYRKCMQEQEMKIVKNQMKRISKARSIQETMQDRPKIDLRSDKIASLSPLKSVSTAKHQGSDPDVSDFIFMPKTREGGSSHRGIDNGQSRVLKRSSIEVKPLPKGLNEKVSPLKNKTSTQISVSDKIKSQALLKITQHVKIAFDSETGTKVFKPVEDLATPRVSKNGRVIIHNKAGSAPDIDNILSPEKAVKQGSKKRIYLEIFDKLKGASGTIENENLNISSLNEKTAKIIEPVLNWIKSLNRVVDFDLFAEKLDELIQGLQVGDKKYLMTGMRTGSFNTKKSMHKHSMSTGSFGSKSSRENASKRTDYSERSKEIIVETKNFTSFPKISPALLKK